MIKTTAMVRLAWHKPHESHECVIFRLYGLWFGYIPKPKELMGTLMFHMASGCRYHAARTWHISLKKAVRIHRTAGRVNIHQWAKQHTVVNPGFALMDSVNYANHG